MPLARYFLFVGGTLLALLFISDAYLPKPEASIAVTEVVKPLVRIHSDQKLPERVVIDTSIPTIVPQSIAVAEAPAKLPALNALAQVTPSELKAAELKTADLKKTEPKAAPKRKVAKRVVRQPMVAYAQAPARWDFDFFARN